MTTNDHCHNSSSRRVIIVTGGDAPNATAIGSITATDHVICADGGVDHALALGWRPSIVVGDLDSASPEGIHRAREFGAEIRSHPRDKDATDTELALLCAVELGVDHVCVISGGGDRLDHFLGWWAALSHPDLARIAYLDAWFAATRIAVIHGPRERSMGDFDPGQTLSLIPIGGDTHGVSTTGLIWALDAETLSATSSRGVSNETLGGLVTIRVDTGVLAVIHPPRSVSPSPRATPKAPHDSPASDSHRP